MGLTYEEIQASRRARTNDRKTNAALEVVLELVMRSPQTINAAPNATHVLRDAGYGDAEIIEIVAQVGLNVFENYLNNIAHTELDFPRVGFEARAAA